MLKPTLLPVEISDALTRYIIRSRTAIIQLLEEARAARATLSCHLEGGFIAAEASVERVAAGDDVLVLMAASAVEHDLLIAAKSITAVGFREGVKIQFRSEVKGALRLAEGEGIRVSLPQELLRLQRRRFDRARPSSIHPLECMVRGRDNVPTLRRLPVLDLSIGGVALLSRRPGEAYEIGQRLVNCSFNLGNDGELLADLTVRNVERLGPSGARRYGCAFVDMNDQALKTLARYLWRIDALKAGAR